MSEKAPAYQRYPDKWLADTRRLSWAAKGIYADLLDMIWMQHQDTCSVPDDPAYIAAELGCTIDEWEGARAEIMNEHRPLMRVAETNRLFSNGLWKEREKQLRRREQLRENGKKGGRPKTKGKQKVIPKKPDDNQNISLPSPSPVPSPSPAVAETDNSECLESFKASNPHYAKLIAEPGLGCITPEQWQKWVTFYLDADMDAVVEAATMGAMSAVGGLDNPGSYVHKIFKNLHNDATTGKGKKAMSPDQYFEGAQ